MVVLIRNTGTTSPGSLLEMLCGALPCPPREGRVSIYVRATAFQSARSTGKRSRSCATAPVLQRSTPWVSAAIFASSSLSPGWVGTMIRDTWTGVVVRFSYQLPAIHTVLATPVLQWQHIDWCIGQVWIHEVGVAHSAVLQRIAPHVCRSARKCSRSIGAKIACAWRYACQPVRR